MTFDNDYFYDESREGFYVPGLMKKCWAAQLEVLRDIDELCMKYQIEYFAEWGTLLGAVRHGGFIPWDDDLDICMKREHYIRFLEVIDELKNKYIVSNFWTEERRNNFLTRVVNINQFRFDDEFMEIFHEFPYPVGIDIFPMDYAPPKEKEEAYFEEMRYLITVGEAEDHLKVSKKDLETAVKKVENKYRVKIDRNKPLMSQIYRVTDKMCAKFSEDESEYLTLMPVWLENHNYKIPKELYDKSIRIPYENTTIPVPIGYDKILEIKYHNYMKPVICWDSHDYPYYKGNEEVLKERHNIEFAKYHFNPKDLIKEAELPLSEQLNNFIPLLGEAHEELSNLNQKLTEEASEETVQTICNLLGDCQEGAIAMGNLIEATKGEGADVSYLEEYCELIYEASENFGSEAIDKLNHKLHEIIEKVSIIDKKEKQIVLFIVARECEWKYVKDIYSRYAGENEYDVYVMPVPYYDKSFKGEIKASHCDYDKFPKTLPLINYELYHIEVGRPDVIVTTNTYDEKNFTYSSSPTFYSSTIKNYTKELIYVPPFETSEFNPKDERSVGMMENYVYVPGVVHADKVWVQSENIRLRYIDYLTEKCGEDTKAVWEEKIEIRPVAITEEVVDSETVAKWKGIINNNNSKKILLYVTSMGAIMSNPYEAAEKIRTTLKTFNDNSDKIGVIWRPNFIENIAEIDDVNLKEKLEDLVEEYSNKDWCIIDKDTCWENAVNVADAFFGDGCVEATRVRLMKKPVMLQNYQML